MDKTQREQLLKLAQKDPSFKAKLVNILKTEKIATALNTEDAAAFAAWAKMSNPQGMSVNEVISYLTRAGVKVRPQGESAPPKKKGPLEVGELVKVDPSKCIHPDNKRNCGVLEHTPDNEQYCYVVARMEPADLRELCTYQVSPIDTKTGKVGSKKFEFKAVMPARGIAGLTKKLEKAEAKGDTTAVDRVLGEMREKALAPHNGHGLYRASFKDLAHYKKVINQPKVGDFVMVYERGGKLPVPSIRKQYAEKSNVDRTRQTLLSGEFDDLVEGGLSDYAKIYYEGQMKGAGYSKSDEFYFLMDTVSQGFTNANPTVGTVYYIAKASDMPSEREWKDDLRARLKAVVEEHLKGSL
jgi:hypothetical protein